MRLNLSAGALALALSLSACSGPQADLPVQQAGTDEHGFSPADTTTLAAQANAAQEVDAERQSLDLELAERGLLAREPDLAITGPDGAVIWQPGRYDFLDAPARQRRIPISGTRPAWPICTGSTRSPPASTRCAAMTCPTCRSLPVRPAGSSSTR